MDYWALGHVHTRAILSESPWAVYPGNIQGRSIREQGARGCYHVRVDEGGRVTLEFVPLDVVRWSELQVAIDRLETIDALERAVVETVEKASAGAGGRAVVCRVSIVGRGPLHADLRRRGSAEQLLERVRERFSAEDSFVWVERLAIASRPEVDLAECMGRQDLLAEVLATAKEYRDGPGGSGPLFEEALAALWENSRVAKAQVERPTDDQVEAILQEAELLCLDLLEGEE
jgi:DNA repair exonuclease SbcCD nuclease subunit